MSQLPAIEITIGEVVLHGVRPGDQHDFAAALTERLTALVEDSAAAAGDWRSRQESSHRTDAVQLTSASPSELGAAIAGQVHGLLAGNRGRT